MNSYKLIIAAALLAGSGAAAHCADKPDKYAENKARLEKMLEGREAGEPVSCIPMWKSNRLEVIDGVALVYKEGDTIYVARPRDPEMLGRDDVIVIDRFGSQLCNIDVVRTIDRTGGYATGVVFLDKFVPYRKVD
jgi:hypothetical protein